MSEFNKNLICPETGLIFCDPVRIKPEGRVYERLMLKRWIDQGHSTCPYETPIALNTKLQPAEDIKAAIEATVKSPALHAHWQSHLYKSYQEAKITWQKNGCSNIDGFVDAQLNYLKQNAHNAQCQRIGLSMLTLSSLTAISLILNHIFLWISLSAISLIIAATCLSLMAAVSFIIWLSPAQSAVLIRLFPTLPSSARKNLCETLNHIWNPQNLETFKRYNHHDLQTTCQKQKYSMSFAQLVLSCPALKMFNVSDKKTLPMIKLADKEVIALNPYNATNPYHYWQFSQSIKQLQLFKAHPEKLNFPNQIPLILRPLQGLIIISYHAIKACTFSKTPPLRPSPESLGPSPTCEPSP